VYERINAVNRGVDIQTLPLRAVDYARVSTGSREQRRSFENQLETYRQLIEEVAAWEYAGTYSDEAVTGTKAGLRGGFQQMIRDARAGCFDLIVVKDIARFARNIKDCLVYKDQLKSCGVMVWFVKENLNTFRKSDEMMLAFMAMGAELEAKSARERTKIVFDQGIQKGRIYGNSKILGYKKDHCRLVMDEEEAEIVRLIFDLYVHERMGLRRIARELAVRGLTRGGTPIPMRTIKTALENPKYKGFYAGGKTQTIDLGERSVRRPLPAEQWVVYRDPAIPAIVSEALWNEAEEIRKSRAQTYRETVKAPCNRGKYRYSGKLFSEAAGAAYSRICCKSRGTVREGWQCRSRHPGGTCPTLYSDELDAAVQQVLAQVLGSADALAEVLTELYRQAMQGQDASQQLQAIAREKAAIAGKQQRLLVLYEEGLLDKSAYAARALQHQQALQTLARQEQGLLSAGEAGPCFLSEPEALRAHIRHLVLHTPPSKEVIERLLERILVKADSTKALIHLELVLRGCEAGMLFEIRRPNGHGAGGFSCKCCIQRTST